MATAEGQIHDRRHIPDRRTNAHRVGGKPMGAVDWIAMLLLIIGGINWGLIGLFGFDLVATLFGDMSPLSRIIYILVGLSALYSIYTSSKMYRARS